jgi:hypothetical protein
MENGKEEVYKRNFKNSEDLEQKIEFLKLVHLSSFTQHWIVLRFDPCRYVVNASGHVKVRDISD